MDLLFVDENESCQIAFNGVVWATDKLHDIFHQAKANILCDVDAVVETENELIFVEYKNANIKSAKSPESFRPLEDKKINNVVRKYYDSQYFLNAIGHSINKHKSYVYIMESLNGDSVLRGLVCNRLKSLLPFLLQEQNNVTSNLIDEVEVVSVAGWNEKYPEYPATMLQ